MPLGPWSPSQTRGPMKGSGPALPGNTLAPVASGTVTIGGTLSVTNGTWSSVATPTFTYQWQRAGVNIAAATANSYTPVAADIGPAITCIVTATNSVGSTPATSNALAYDITADTNVIEAWIASSLSAGAVSSWAGLKSVATLVQATGGKQPTAAATSFNSKPGVTFAGGQVLATGGLATPFSTRSGMTLGFNYKDSTASTEVVFDCDGGVNGNGVEIITNDSGGAGNWEGLVSSTGWKSAAGDFSAAIVSEAGFDRSIDRDVSYLRQAETSLTLTNRGSPVTSGGNFAFTNFYVGGRGTTPTLGCTGTLNAIAVCVLMAAGSNAQLTVGAWLAYQGGL